MEHPAIFEVEPIGVGGALEANGTVYPFCSEVCLTAFESDNPAMQTKVGAWGGADLCEGTRCCYCGVTLV